MILTVILILQVVIFALLLLVAVVFSKRKEKKQGLVSRDRLEYHFNSSLTKLVNLGYLKISPKSVANLSVAFAGEVLRDCRYNYLVSTEFIDKVVNGVVEGLEIVDGVPEEVVKVDFVEKVPVDIDVEVNVVSDESQVELVDEEKSKEPVKPEVNENEGDLSRYNAEDSEEKVNNE